TDGRSALDAAGAIDADLVITDVNMPEMDGLTLVRELRARPAYRFTPILVLTTESGDDMKRRGRDAGATGWLVKPFDAARLRQTVSFVLAQKRPLAQTPLDMGPRTTGPQTPPAGS